MTYQDHMITVIEPNRTDIMRCCDTCMATGQDRSEIKLVTRNIMLLSPEHVDIDGC